MAQLLSVESTKKTLSPSVLTTNYLNLNNTFKVILKTIFKQQIEQAKIFNLFIKKLKKFQKNIKIN